MAILTCPHCGNPGITMMRKMALGPAVPATCQSCQKKIGVPWTSLIGVLPFIVAIGVYERTRNVPLGIAAILLAGVFMFIYQARYVPLEKR